MYRTRLLLAAAALLLLALPRASFGQGDAPRRTVWDGVFTEAQARRGQSAYVTHCAGCHMDDLSGRDEKPALKGAEFMERWREFELAPLFSLMKSVMPPRALPEDPPPLSDATYLDILAFMLEGNGFPAGSRELAADSLSGTVIVREQGRQEPVPDGALILTVGCLAQVSEGRGFLVRATEPVRTVLSDEPTPAELAASTASPWGSAIFRLVNYDYIAPDFTLEPYVGQKIQVKGFLIRQPNAERINVTSLRSVGPTCAY